MVLTDREISTRVASDELIDSFDPACLTNIGYDLRAKYFVVSSSKEKLQKVTLNPNESVFVASVENICVSNDLIGRLYLKNSRIRQGFTMDAPVYQPGHHTKVFFRLTNVSADSISLYAGEKYATILFETLKGVPDHPYDGVFSDEFDYKGLGDYEDVYKRQMREIDQKVENLKSVEQSIYSNVLVILTIFVALFSFIVTNLSFWSKEVTAHQFFTNNALMLGCISFLVALLKSFISSKKRNWTVWIPCVVAFTAAFILFIT